MEVALRGISQRLRRSAMPPGPADAFSTARAIRAARRAANEVSTYRQLLGEQDISSNGIRTLEELPESDKKTYADRFPQAERIIRGKLPSLARS